MDSWAERFAGMRRVKASIGDEYRTVYDRQKFEAARSAEAFYGDRAGEATLLDAASWLVSYGQTKGKGVMHRLSHGTTLLEKRETSLSKQTEEMNLSKKRAIAAEKQMTQQGSSSMASRRDFVRGSGGALGGATTEVLG